MFKIELGDGVIDKRKDGTSSAGTPWLEIKNPTYNQVEGRGRTFQRRRLSGTPIGVMAAAVINCPVFVYHPSLSHDKY